MQLSKICVYSRCLGPRSDLRVAYVCDGTDIDVLHVDAIEEEVKAALCPEQCVIMKVGGPGVGEHGRLLSRKALATARHPLNVTLVVGIGGAPADGWTPAQVLHVIARKCGATAVLSRMAAQETTP